MSTLYIPPPTVEAIAWDWAKKLSQEYGVKVTVTIDRGAWGCSEMSFNPKSAYLFPSAPCFFS